MPMELPNGQNIRSINKSTKETYRNNEHQTSGDGIKIPFPGCTAGSDIHTGSDIHSGYYDRNLAVALEEAVSGIWYYDAAKFAGRVLLKGKRYPYSN